MNRGQPTITCLVCKGVIPNDYRSHKNHVINKHLKEINNLEDQAAFISQYIQTCFPGAISLNDYMVRKE